jgi:hypothetical protein
LDEYQRISPAQVTLAPSGGEGGRSMGAMRWAQSANYGVAPNPAMPRTWPGENAGPYDMEIKWNMWENHGKNMGKHGNIMGKIMAKTWEKWEITPSSSSQTIVTAMVWGLRYRSDGSQ